MAHHQSAKKSIRQNAGRAEVNTARRSRIRTFIKKVEVAITAGDHKTAQEALRVAQPELMRGVKGAILKMNTAARKISRLNARIKGLASK
jgi:small subunit ribosomal protein S20